MGAPDSNAHGLLNGFPGFSRTNPHRPGREFLAKIDTNWRQREAKKLIAKPPLTCWSVGGPAGAAAAGVCSAQEHPRAWSVKTLAVRRWTLLGIENISVKPTTGYAGLERQVRSYDVDIICSVPKALVLNLGLNRGLIEVQLESRASVEAGRAVISTGALAVSTF
jgi:alkyl hydroperoxide reductase subunit AhpF